MAYIHISDDVRTECFFLQPERKLNVFRWNTTTESVVFLFEFQRLSEYYHGIGFFFVLISTFVRKCIGSRLRTEIILKTNY